MATMILSAAGNALGGSLGGGLLGAAGGAMFGKAVGAVAGGLIDQAVFGRGGRAVETGRIDRLRVQGASEGEAVQRVWGRMRVGGNVIWSTRFNEHVEETKQGGKGGGQKVRAYSYTISFAVALCEGPIARIGRVWADGNEITLTEYSYRLHKGFDGQPPDALIDEVEGGAPGFCGVAYLVFEDMPLESFGNRIPQISAEVFREPPASASGAPQLSKLVKGVALSPGSGEFSLDTEKVMRTLGPGQSVYENVNTRAELPDIRLGLNQLQAEAPECETVSLIVSWFGDDLRCGACQIQPCVETDDKETEPVSWRVSGVSRGAATVVSQDAEGRPVYGGTPDDSSVVRAIQEIKARGLKVMFYPFILMDVPAGNGKPDPWGGVEQAPFPWRGRITLNAAPGRPGSPDKTSVAGDQVAAFFGDAALGDFSVNGERVSYSGPAEWSFRRFILHYAHLCAAAGGVDAFCIGSEMRSLTHIRSSANAYPAVSRLKSLAGDARTALGPGVKIGYAADWSEYFGHQPGDGDLFFHLDPLWADPDIDFVGIDNYLPLSDWRDRAGHADEDAGSVYDLDYLKANVAGGEGYEWYYATQTDRDAQIRTPIIDTAHGEDWVFRPKDIRSWWEHAHHNRPGGVRNAAPTAWVPKSKPIWFTEIGCPAVDLGANQPNVFVDPKSSESALPYYSRGVRDDFMQRRYLEAALDYWADAANNPIGDYGAPMVDTSKTYLWTWDARPWPDFPNDELTWSDGPNHRLGHWLTGRLGAASLSDVVADICRESGLTDFDVSGLHDVVQGYVRDSTRPARETLQPLMLTFGFDAVESGGVVKFRHRARPVDRALTDGDATLSRMNGPDFQRVRGAEGEAPRAVRLSFVDGDNDYEPGAIEATSGDAASTRVETSSAPIVLDGGSAQDVAEKYIAEARTARDGASLTCGLRLLELEPGDLIEWTGAAGAARYRIDGVEDGATRELTLSRVETQTYTRTARKPVPPRRRRHAPAAPLAHDFLNLPLLRGDEAGPKAAAFGAPWTGAAALYAASGDSGFDLVATLPRPAVMGELAEELPAASPDHWTRDAGAVVRLYGGGLSSVNDLEVLNGRNFAALLTSSGEWEVLQFQTAELIGANIWRLTRMLRGQAGTETFIDAPTAAGARFILLNGALGDLALPQDLRGVERNWRIGPARKPVGDPTYRDFAASDNAARLRPYAPAHLRARANAVTGDIAIDWVRRARFGGDSWDGEAPPLGESRERYRIRIGALREAEVSATGFVYDAAMQAADGLSGAATVAVAQLSDQYGPGPDAEVTINV